ncbi:hypothetical protein EDC04DRAFT_2934178 [Pisolithus marmoratus]|nr:hypothetical protein EDC04DRAFT_2934178 [Pisolithus marmoratus]
MSIVVIMSAVIVVVFAVIIASVGIVVASVVVVVASVVVIIVSVVIVVASVVVIIATVIFMPNVLVLIAFQCDSRSSPSATCRLQLHKARVVSPLSALHLASALWIWWDFVSTLGQHFMFIFLSVLAVQASLIQNWFCVCYVGYIVVLSGWFFDLLLLRKVHTGLYVITPDSKSIMNAASATDQTLSALVHHTLSSVLGGSRLCASAVIQRCDLQKTRLRVRSQLTNLQRDMAEELLPPAAISCHALKLTAQVISHAILNPYKTKYFPHPQWGHISDPTTILDVHGRVLEHLSEIHIPLKDSLVQCSKTGWPSKRRFGHKHVPEEDGNEKFGHVRLMNSPATFQQAHTEYFWRLIDPQRLEEWVYESFSLKKPAVRQWLRDITYAEDFWNTIAEIVLPDLAQVGKEAISAKQHWVTTQPPCPVRWPSIYLGIDVIVNQKTPPHQDQASAPSLLDLVPGTMVFLAGKLLIHSVPKWEKGEMVALAHYMKDAIHNIFGLARPIFTQQKDLLGVFFTELVPPRPKGESSPTKKWMLGTSTSHLAVCLPLHELQEPWDPPKISTSLTFPTLLTSLTLTGMMQKISPSPEGTQSQNDFVREWLPWRAEYINVILEGEQLAKAGICEQCEEAEGSVWCMSCTGVHAWCGPCAVKAHTNLPFHKVQRWNGTHYEPTSLMELGFLWHIGHGGDPCPQNSSDPDPDESGYITGEEPPNHRQRLFPASISKPKTAFTFAVLDHFLIDALECKTSAMTFYQKLKRFTNNAFPERDRYRELMRVSWLWRDLKHRKWFGFGHDMEQDPGDGGLALFCPACPHPGVNLPADWKVCYDRDTIMRQYVIDGNFTAQHMKMNKPELDVTLSDGKGYMVAEVPYQSHLKQSLDSKERSTCSNHRAINAANINKSNLQSTGIGATACAQHGCFVPHSMVDFQKGERYMNTDYSICNALGYHSESITKALVIYDVGCQWSINFRSRVKNSPSLLLPPALEIVPAVGKFHLAAHKLSCFPRYSLNFIKGAGHLEGEILETLWAPFNKISPTARSMTQAHRQEKYKNSKKCLEEMNQAYEQLTAVLDPDKVARWESDALRAEADRGEALDIYLLKGDKAPTFQEVWLQSALRAHSEVPVELKTCRDQLRSEIRQLPSPMSTRQEVKISEKRQQLSSRIEKFHSNGQAFGKGLDIDGTFISQDDPAFCGSDEEEHEDREFWDDDEGDWEAPEEEVEGLASELMSIWMPSSIGAAKLTELGLHDLLKEERELRIGQANDCLDQLRTDLGNKAMLYQQKLQDCKFHQGGYQDQDRNPKGGSQGKQACQKLSKEKYQEILPEDLVVSKEVTEENRFGQGTSKLAWFWVIDGEKSQLNVEAGGLVEEFYRINWLKARARRDRWKEEVSLVRHEMLWTGLWFEYHKKMWEQRALQSTEPGKEAYANKQMGLWSDFASKARLMFHGKQMNGI